MKIFCSGIGGIGLSAYAALQQSLGHSVSGSDRADSIVTQDLEDRGVVVSFNQDGSAVPDDIDLFVYSEAIPETAPERVKAAELGVPQKSYFGALGELSKDYHCICVCGTHGKSSTTSMASKVLLDAGVDPTVVVGTRVPDLDGRNWRKGESDVFLLEACEYRCSFHHLHPNIVLLTNADGDHFDAFADEHVYRDAFLTFLKKIPPDGVCITHGNDPVCQKLVAQLSCRVVDADQLPLPDLSVPGQHMQENAQLVVALSEVLQLDLEQVTESLVSYQGCWRRLEDKGVTESGARVIDDYAHHPHEITATIRAIANKYQDKRLVVAFQPHMHNRTVRLYDDFVTAFKGVDKVVALDVYDARSDTETETVDMDRFVSDIAEQSSTQVVRGYDIVQAEPILREELTSDAVLLVMGAGDITKLAEKLVS